MRMVLVFLLVTGYCFGFSYTVKLTDKQIQEKIEKKFPFEKKKFLTKVILSNPEVILKEGKDKVYVSLDLEFRAAKISFDGYTELNGKIFFDSKNKKFYFKDLEVEELVIDKVPIKYHNKIEKMVQFIAQMVLNKYPIYKMKGKDLKNNVAMFLLKDVKVKDKVLNLTIGF